MKRNLLPLTFLVFAVGLSAQANLLNNGNFNTGNTSGWWIYLADPGNQAITVLNNVPFSYDGSPYLYVSNRTGSYSSKMGQEVSLTPGTPYQVSLVFRATLWGGAGVEIIYYNSSWQQLGDLYGWTEGVGYQWTTTFTGHGTDTGWLPFSSPVWTAPPETAYVSMRLHEWGWADGYFDNFELTIIPEPSSVALLAGAGLALLILHRRRA